MSDATLETLLKVTRKLTAVRSIRLELERIANRLLAGLSADVVTIYSYNPYWDEFQIPITSGKMEAIVPPYTGETLRELLNLRDQPDEIIEDSAALFPIASQFLEREQIETLNVGRVFNHNLPLCLVFINWRQKYTLSVHERQLLSDQLTQIRKLNIHNYPARHITQLLYQEMGFDIVRLHLIKQDDIGIINDISKLRWGFRPITHGHIENRDEPEHKCTTNPVTDALNRFIKDGQTSLFQDDAQRSRQFPATRFTQREGIQTNGYVVLVVNEGTAEQEIIGVLFVNWRKRQRWSYAKETTICLLARRMANAIHTRRLVTILKEQSISENWLQELLGRVMRNRSSSREEALQLVLQTAASLTGSYFGIIRLRSGDELVIEAKYHVDALEQSAVSDEHQKLPIYGAALTSQTFRADEATIFPDVNHEPNYLQLRDDTQSEMVVIIRHVVEGVPIGTINLEHKVINGFNKDDRLRVIAIADVTAIILHNIDRYYHLEEERRSLRHLEQIAVNGLIGANWLHTIGTRCRAIDMNVDSIRHLLNHKPDDMEKIDRLLERIVNTANDLVELQRTLPERLETSPEPLLLDQLLAEFIESRQHTTNFKSTLDLRATGAMIEMHEIAVKTVVNHLLDNSIQAARTINAFPTVKVTTEIDGKYIKIVYIDNGPGIDKEQRKYYLRTQMPVELRFGASGMGMNIVQFLLHRYGGDIRYFNEPTVGTRHEIWLPVMEDERRTVANG